MNEIESTDQIRDLLGKGIGEEPPIVGGPAAVFAGARARAVRTRAVTSALTLVAALGVAAGMVALGSGSRASAPASQPGPVAVGSSEALMDGRSADALLKSLLPAGFTTADYSGMDNSTQSPSGAVVGMMAIDDGTGKPTQITVSVGRQESEAVSGQICDDRFHYILGSISGCQAQLEQDGSVVVGYRLEDNHLGADGQTLNAYQLVAERLFPNGVKVLVAAANWLAPEDVSPGQLAMIAPTHPAPLVTQDELLKMVSDPRWGLTVPADFAQQARRDITPYTELASGTAHL